MNMSNQLKSGKNELFTDPNADKAREYFRTKSRALKSKLSTVEDIVRDMISDGDYIAIGGFGANRIPTAIVHEIVRQKKRILDSPDILRPMISRYLPPVSVSIAVILLT